ncbi:hypothetical protein F938_01365 [Acinetobacter bereziniae LMG 1003 = CIP 70.12]|uniref:RHS protein conserved region domain-containing protein n=1 Tax=Acinetobacter bereziniae LMG 1003 = CIP 70.12 TaxID=981324 RepID=N9EZ61_ACIBZ|nr:hypothetical protein F938_01365 [Acinetobacter bereziniae LMG 1003 = CIP 70.12]
MIETSQSGQTLKLTWDNLNRLIQSDHNGQITSYGYDVFGRRLFKKNTTEDSLTLFGWDGDLMIWESQRSNKENYTKHYVYEPDSFVPLLQTGYTRFIQLIETPDYRQFQDVPYSIYKDPVWKTDTQKNKAELERVAFYHCDQVGTPQTLSNELGECIWEIKQDTWGAALEIKAIEQDNPFGHSNIRFQGQYYDKETGLHYNRYRYYEPYSARYVSKDPIGLLGGLNLKDYVLNPIQWCDPLGLASERAGTNAAIEIYNKSAPHLPDNSIPMDKIVAAQLEKYAKGKSVGGSTTVGVGVGIYATYKGNGVSTLTMERKLGLEYEYGVFKRDEKWKYKYGERQVNRPYVQSCAGTGKAKYCAGAHTDKFNPYVYKDKAVGRSRTQGISISQGKEMVGNPNGPSITHGTGHTWDLGAHGFPSTY